MKESEEESLIPLVKMLKYQEYCELTLKKGAYMALDKHDGLCGYHEGLAEKENFVLVELCLNRVIEVSVATRRLLRVNGEEVSGIVHNQVVDLDDDGERWEGDVLQSKPYGWGVVYDSENRMAYEGFRIGNVNMCYGTRYYSDIGVIAYEGEWFEGKRWGRGVQYDRTGNKVFDGEWRNDEQLSKRVVLSEENQLLHNRIEELIVQDKSCNGREWSALDLSLMPSLRVLEVGDDCFQYVEEVKLIGLSQLERVVIGKECFTTAKNWYGYDPSHRFYLKNCPHIRELKMGCDSFSDYSVCEIENVPSLEVIEMGELDDGSSNFHGASLELKGDSQRVN